MRTLTWFFLAFLTLSSPLLAEDMTLYRDFTFGMAKVDIQRFDENIYDCSKEFAKDTLCLDNQKFAKQDIGIGFEFVQQKLVRVHLLSEFSPENYASFISVLSSRFQLSKIENKANFSDVLTEFKSGDFRQKQAALVDFEQQSLNSGYIKYTFIDKRSFEKYAAKSNSTTELLLNSELTTRTAQYIVFEEGKQAFGIITFDLPTEYSKLFTPKNNDNYEDF